MSGYILMALVVPFAIFARGIMIFPRGAVAWRLGLMFALYVLIICLVVLLAIVQYSARSLPANAAGVGVALTLPALMIGVWLIFRTHDGGFGAGLIALVAVPLSLLPIALLSWGTVACSHADCF